VPLGIFDMLGLVGVVAKMVRGWKHLQVFNRVIVSVVIAMVDVIAFRNGAVMMLPYHAVQPLSLALPVVAAFPVCEPLRS
jgi:hypothetical protein